MTIDKLHEYYEETQQYEERVPEELEDKSIQLVEGIQANRQLPAEEPGCVWVLALLPALGLLAYAIKGVFA